METQLKTTMFPIHGVSQALRDMRSHSSSRSKRGALNLCYTSVLNLDEQNNGKFISILVLYAQSAVPIAHAVWNKYHSSQKTDSRHVKQASKTCVSNLLHHKSISALNVPLTPPRVETRKTSALQDIRCFTNTD